jgi:hypothetical protein
MIRPILTLLVLAACVPGSPAGGDTDTADTDTSSGVGHTDAVDSDEPGDTDVARDTVVAGDTEVVTDTDAVGETDDGGVVATGDVVAEALPASTGPCVPPDRWTGPVPPSLYVPGHYDPAYDSELDTVIPGLFTSWGSTGRIFTSKLVLGATIVAITPVDADSYFSIVWLADGRGAAPIRVAQDTYKAWRDLRHGDRVSVGIDSYETPGGLATLQDFVTLWHLDSHDNPVAVHQLGATNVRYDQVHSQLTQVYGELTAVSNHDCDDDHLCFRLAHDGTEDFVRVNTLNTFGLDLDYAGGRCAEVIAPAGVFASATGTVMFLDVAVDDWMRVWPKP